MSSRILVAGLGNVLMRDDAVGPYCVERLNAGYWFPKEVEIADLGTPGLGLALHLSTADRVLVINAVRGVPPGTIEIYDLEDIVAALRDAHPAGARLETHSPALAEAVLIARLAGDRPRDIRLVGLAGSSFEHGTELSPNVRAYIPLLIQRVLDELSNWDVEWVRRQRVRPVPVWWEEPPAIQRGSIRNNAPSSSAVST